MRVTNLKIGNTYYLPVKYNPTNYTSGVLVEILEGNQVLLQSKKGPFKINANKLHKRPDEAVKGMKAQERVRFAMYNMGKKEKAIYKSLQKEVKNLGYAAYLVVGKNAQYTVNGYCGKISFNTLDEVQEWVKDELIELKKLRSNLSSYKFLQVGTRLYKIISVSFNSFVIRIQKNNCTEDVPMSAVLKKEDLKNRFKISSI